MSTDHHVTAIGAPDGPDAECWCCGTVETPDRMVQLGDHPEVRLCLQCAHVVHRRARQVEDRSRPGPAATARRRLRRIRARVIRRGWQHHRYLGASLRWLGRRLP